jgi:hypothetical protein
MNETMKDLGWTCEKTIVIYIYGYYHNPKNKDPWIWSYGNNDFHAIRLDHFKKQGDRWSYVPKDINHTKDKVPIRSTPDIKNPDSYWTGRPRPAPIPRQRYCCCKPKYKNR